MNPPHGRTQPRRTHTQLPVSASGRTPQWVIDEARELHRTPRILRGRARRRAQQRRDQIIGPSDWRSWDTAPRHVPRRRRRTAAIAAVALSLALGAGAFGYPHLLPYLPGAVAPPAGLEASTEPIGTPPVVPEAPGYGFYTHGDQQMIAMDPCRQVHYVVRNAGAPAGSDQLITDAVAEIEAATGLHFVYDGTTEEVPDKDRDPYQPSTYGHRWAPVLIAWSNEEETPELAGAVTGVAGPIVREAPGGERVIVSGHVMLDTPDLLHVAARPQGLSQVRATIMHELGHVVGLTHVEDSTQLMHATSTEATGFAAGDRAGLAKLGAGKCHPQL